VHELVGAGERRAPFVKRDPDFATAGVEWRPIERDPDGFWTIPPITPTSTTKGPDEQFGFTVRAGPLKHSVPTFGYTVVEKPKRGKLDAAKVRAMGLAPGPLYKQLARGQDVVLPNGRGVLRASEVLGPPRRGRKLTVLGDTCDAGAMAALAMDSDVLVHEATLEDGLAELAVLRGHSTPSMAARFARDVRARRLLLTHFSNRYSSYAPVVVGEEAAAAGGGGGCGDGVRERPDVARLLQQAVAVLGDERRVLAAHDFLQVNVPSHGFGLVGALPRGGGRERNQQQHHQQQQQQQQQQQPQKQQPRALQWPRGAGADKAVVA
jgi:ribonuclease BN (tRNA processing enzyme)